MVYDRLGLRGGTVGLDLRGSAGEPVARDEAVFDERPQRLETVARADLLSFGNAAGVIADRHFLDRVAQAPQLGGDFGTELEAAAFKMHIPNAGGTKRLVRCPFVREGGQEEHVE